MRFSGHRRFSLALFAISFSVLIGLPAVFPVALRAQTSSVFGPTGSLITARRNPTATLLNNGLVLIAGGCCDHLGNPLTTAELYNPATGNFTPTGSLHTGRNLHTATLLQGGTTVLIAGGYDYNGNAISSAELYNANTGSFTSTGIGPMMTPRAGHTATLLQDGTVLFVGGLGNTGVLAAAELYIPASNAFTATNGSLPAARYLHTATLLQDGTGNVLIAGGADSNGQGLSSALLYNFSSKTFGATTGGNMTTPRYYHAATLLQDGTVLLVGGYDSGTILNSAELYTPSTQSFAATGSLTMPLAYEAATTIANGSVVITGGYTFSGGNYSIVNAAEIYTQSTKSFANTTGNMNTARYFHTATLLQNGLVLIAGGEGVPTAGSSFNHLSSAELFTDGTPLITGLSSAFGPPGFPLTITGANFGATQGTGSTVTLNGVASTPISWSSTAIVVPVPASATSGSVLVTVGGLQSNGVDFAVIPASPAITSISPVSGSAGTVVTVTGQGFGSTQGTSSVTFNSIAAAPTPNSWSNTSFTVPAPAGVSTGPVQVTVGDYASNGVTFSVGPSISSLSPSAGPTGSSVIINGLNFGAVQTNTSVVAFNGWYAPVSSWSTNQIVVTVPAGTTTGPVVVNVGNVPSNGANFVVGIGSISGKITNSNAGSAISAALVQALQSNGVIGSATTASDGTYTISSVAPGTYDVKVSASGFGTSLVAGQSVVAGGSTTVNASLSSPGTIAGKVTQSDGVTAIVGASISVTQNSDSIGSTTTGSTGSYSVSTLTPGTYSVQVAALGFIGQLQSGLSVTAGNTTTVNFSLVGQPTITYSYDSLGRLAGVVNSLGNAAAYSYDPVGNLLSITQNPSAQTSISGFVPQSGPTSTSVTINGTGFSSTASQDTVKFNGTSASVTFASATQLIAAVPTNGSTGKVTVTAPSGSAASTGNFSVIAANTAPTITTFSPSIGVPGSPITITGTNFDGTPTNDRVKLNNTLLGLTSASTTTLAASVPTNSTSGHIQVQTIQGQASTNTYFLVVPPPNALASVGYTGSLAIGGSVTVSIATANQIGLVAFDATAGQVINLAPTNNTYVGTGCGAGLSILNPNGTTLASSNTGCSGGIFNTTLPATGTYTVLISPGNSTGSVTLTLTQNQTGTISFNTPQSVSNTLAGQTIDLTFTGGAGRIISLSPANNGYSSGCGAGMSILSPDGNTLASGTSSSTGCLGGIFDAILPTTGTYTIVISPGDFTGSVTLTLTQNQIGTISFNTPQSVSNTLAGQTIDLTFSGTTGQVINLAPTNNTYAVGCGAGLTILNPSPNQTTLASTNTGCNGGISNTALPSTGTYTIVISPGDSTGSVTLTLTHN